MSNLVPFIPDNAPFTPEQRGWLNGFLAGLYSTATAAASPLADPPPSLKIAVLYASQSGTAEGLARKVTKHLKAKGHIVSLNSLEGYTPAALLAERYAIFIASTYGEGDAPDAVRPFYEQLYLEHFPCCQNLSYSVLALAIPTTSTSANSASTSMPDSLHSAASASSNESTATLISMTPSPSGRPPSTPASTRSPPPAPSALHLLPLLAPRGPRRSQSLAVTATNSSPLPPTPATTPTWLHSSPSAP